MLAVFKMAENNCRVVCLVSSVTTIQADISIDLERFTVNNCITLQERNALALSLLEQMTPILQAYAHSAKLEYDDLYQNAALKILTILDARFEQITYIHAYIAASIRNQLLNTARYCKRREAVSLDAPLIEDVSLTLAYILN